MRHHHRLVRPIVALSVVALMGPWLVTAERAAGQPRASTPHAGDSAAHWPRFRGPDSNPTSDNPNLPVTWSRTENVEWVADVPGVGWSSPIVWGDRIFMTAATSEQPMKPPSLGTEFSNEYIAELRKQGLSPDEINTHNWREWIHPDDWDRIVAESVAGEATLKPFTLEARFRRFLESFDSW